MYRVLYREMQGDYILIPESKIETKSYAETYDHYGQKADCNHHIDCEVFDYYDGRNWASLIIKMWDGDIILPTQYYQDAEESIAQKIVQIVEDDLFEWGDERNGYRKGVYVEDGVEYTYIKTMFAGEFDSIRIDEYEESEKEEEYPEEY